MVKVETENNIDDSDLQSGSAPSTTPQRFRAAIDRATNFLFSFTKGQESPHPDFKKVSGEPWYGNKSVSSSFQLGYQPGHKVIFYFNSDQMALLNDCPHPAKFAPNLEEKPTHEYIGMAYPPLRVGLEAIEDWASRFDKADVYTYGKMVKGEWQAGVFVRKVEKTAESG